MSEVIECRVTSGTYVRENAPSTRFYSGSRTSDAVSVAGANRYYTFVHMNMPSELLGKRVVSATFRKRMNTVAGTRTLRVERHAKPSVPYSEMTWNNKPGVLAGSTPVDVTASGASLWWEFDVTADIQAIAQGGAYYGWLISTPEYTGKWVAPGWMSTQAPELIIELDDVPAEPTNVEPDGVVAVAKPVVTWTGPSDMVSAQVQVAADDDPDFAFPLFDSGVESTTVPQLDLDALGFSGIGSGDSVLIRVRHSNSIATSDWSDDATVTYTPHGSLSVTSPSGTTTDPTPTVAWTFSGTQARWQVTTYRNGVVIEDTGVVAGTATSHQPAKGATGSGQVLTYRVRVWDSVARVPSPGDRAYVETSANSTYTPGSVTAVTTLVVVQPSAAPWVDLTWTRAAGVADEWVITRNGEIVARLDGTSGGNPVWSWRDWYLPPNTETEYRVFPVTGTTVGSTGPTADITTVVDGAWVFDPETGDYFTITGHALQIAYAESSVVYEPIGGTRKVKRTWALRGLEGTVGGLLDDWDGRTVADQMVDLFAIKERPDQVVRLAMGDDNIPVTLLNLSAVVSPDFTTTDKIRRDVSFEFFQSGELPFAEVAP